MNKRYWSHYNWLEKHFVDFLTNNGGDWRTCGGIISAHGDKCCGFKGMWAEANIPFPHGVAIYLLTYLKPWSNTVRDTPSGWYSPDKWVLDNYEKFKGTLTTLDLDKVE